MTDVMTPMCGMCERSVAPRALAAHTRLAHHVPSIGIGRGTASPSLVWTNATAVTTKARKAFGAYGVPRLEDPPT